jgi:hypothetical protein
VLKVCLAVLTASWSLAALGQAISGKGTFPQFRNLSGLPGGGYPVNPDGRISLAGHVTLSTPIAYSIKRGYYAGVLGNMSSSERPAWLNSSNGERDANGTFVDNIGIDSPFGSMTVGGMRLSRDGDGVIIVHVESNLSIPKIDRAIGRTRFGYGMQDVLSQGGSSGEDHDRQFGGGKSNSPYVVATTELGRGAYASLGIGTTRFRTIFANVSAPISKNLRGYGEFDGYGVNAGVAFRVNPHLYGTAALVNGRYAFWGLTFTMGK